MTDLKKIFEEQGDIGLYLYKHKHGDALVQASKAELAKTPTGEYQVRVLEVQNIKVTVLKGSDQKNFVPDGRTIYLTAPASMKDPNPEFILDLSVSIREAEQMLLGFVLPEKDEDPQKHADIYHSRQLDLIVNMFKIADEMKDSNNSGIFLDKLKNYGYGNLYKTYAEGVPQSELISEYISQVQDARG